MLHPIRGKEGNQVAIDQLYYNDILCIIIVL